jgi:hypothetical protein
MAINTVRNMFAFIRDLANKEVFDVADSGAPTSGTSGTGVGLLGIGSTYTDTATGNKYVNTGTKASPTWTIIAIAGSGTVTLAMLAAGITPSHVVKFGGTATSGATTATSISVTGVLTTDIAHVTWRGAPQTIATIVATPTTNALTIAFLDGAAVQTVGTAGTLQYTVFRAAS